MGVSLYVSPHLFSIFSLSPEVVTHVDLVSYNILSMLGTHPNLIARKLHNPIQMGKDLNRHISREDLHMVTTTNH